jgi:soluble lytic murein transglycosylase-like protein
MQGDPPLSLRNFRSLSSFSLLVLACLSLGLNGPASASTGKRYVALRRQQNCVRKLTYAEVLANPANYAGRVLELRGTVGGMVETPDGLSLMLNLPDKNAPSLDIPKSEVETIHEYSTPTLRVLVRVGETNTGNVVPLKVLAVAHDSDVGAIERTESAREAAIARAQEQSRREQERWQAEVNRSFHRQSGTQVASRGGFARPLPNDASVASILSYYQGYLGDRVRLLFRPYFDFIYRWNPRLGSQQAGQIAYHLLNFADMNDVDPRLIVAMIIAESDFNPNSTSHTGAMGLGQLMPGTARELGVNNPYDPVQNLYGSIRYLRSRLDTFADKAMPNGGLTFEQAALALAAYNAGAEAVRKFNGIPPYRETQAYVSRIIRLFQQLCQDQ